MISKTHSASVSGTCVCLDSLSVSMVADEWAPPGCWKQDMMKLNLTGASSHGHVWSSAACQSSRHSQVKVPVKSPFHALLCQAA